MGQTDGDIRELNAKMATGHAKADNDSLRAANARLQRQLAEARACDSDGLMVGELNEMRAQLAEAQGKLKAARDELAALGLDLSGDFDSADDVIDVVGAHERELARILKEENE